MKIGILNGKVFDKCSSLKFKRTAENGIELSESELNEIIYLDSNDNDIFINDTWNFELNKSNKDSNLRELNIKSDLEIRLENLEKKIIELENKINHL